MQNDSTKISVRPLGAGLSSYYTTLREMAKFVREATTDYGLKQFCMHNLLANVSGHDFEGEISTLFFSFGTGSLTGATR